MDFGFSLSMVVMVVILVTTIPILWGVYKFVMNLQKGAAEERRLLQTGTPAQGQILAAQQTGTYVNNNPQVQFTVLITPPGGQPYQAQVTKIVSLFEMSQYQVGAACQARIDPMNPQHVAIFPGGMGGAMMGMPPAMGGAPQMMPMQGAPQMMPMQGAPQQGAWPGPPQGAQPQGYGPPQGAQPQGYGPPPGGAPGGYGPPQGGPPQGGWGGQGGQGGPQGGWGR